MPQWPSSLRSRLTLWYTVLLGLPLIGFAIASYVVFARALEGRTDRFIGDALTAFSRELVAERRASLAPLQAMRNTVDEVRFRDLHIAIIDTAARVLAMTAPSEGDAGDRRPPSDVEARIIETLRGHDLANTVALTVA